MVDERFHLRLHFFAVRRNDSRRFGANRAFRGNLVDHLANNLQAFAHFRDANDIAREAVGFGSRGHVELEVFIARIREHFAIVVGDARGTQCGPRHAVGDGVFGSDHADAFQPAEPDAVPGQQLFVFVDAAGHHLQKFFDPLGPARWRLQCQPSDADVAGHHALPGDELENFQDFFALPEAVQKNRHGAHIDGVCAQPDKVRGNSLQFHHQNAKVLSALGYLQAEKFLDREAVNQVVAQRVQIIHAISQRDRLRIRFVFTGLFDAGVEISEIGNGFQNGFTVQFQQNTQHAVGRRVLRSHVEDHCLRWASSGLDGGHGRILV